MVAVIKNGFSIRGSFLYNEQKLTKLVSTGDHKSIPAATLLMAANYPMELHRMNQSQRVNMLLRLAELRPDVKRNSVHITLNFAPGEQLEDAKLNIIASEYMQAIGFGDQPYLVYKHNDAGHPHIHIVSTKIQHNGNRIDMHNDAFLRSEPIRKEIENRHGLVRAEEHRREVFKLKPIEVGRVSYGKTETRRSIAAILEHVLPRYHYSSLAELNAVLNLYNVRADEGAIGSRMHKNDGLVYQLIGADGLPCGSAIKASSFHCNATLKKLRKRFLAAKSAKAEHGDSVRTKISRVLQGPDIKRTAFLKLLKAQGIDVIQNINAEGRLYGITYVDHRSKCVFKGSDLGPEFSANAIAKKVPNPTLTSRHNSLPIDVLGNPHPSNFLQSASTKTVWEILTEPEGNPDYLPPELRITRKKRKKHNRTNN